MKRVAIIGCGALGTTLMRIVKERLSDRYTLCGVMAAHMEHAQEAAARWGCHACGSVQTLIGDRPDIVVELAGAAAVRGHAETILRAGIPLAVASVGALADDALRERLAAAARAGETALYVISGAVGGFDALRTLAMQGGVELTVDNVKAPRSLTGAPYLEGRALSETSEQLAFDGSAWEAIAGFPKNVNVAIGSALAAGTLDSARAVIRSCPGMTDNLHCIQASSPLADLEMTFRSRPDSENPRSSIITAYSAAALLEQLDSPIRFF